MVAAAAVIPAAGKARRFGSNTNKIWSEVAGRAILEWTLSAFDAHPAISSIVLVAGEDELERVRSAASGFAKVTAVVVGGATRSESVGCGLAAVPPGTEIVLVHDAARPLISPALISRVLAQTAESGAAIPGTPVPDTVKRVSSSGAVRETIPRNLTIDGETCTGLTAVQTPQGARLELLLRAYAEYDFASSEPTDEASLLEATGIPVHVVPGEPENIKITVREDLAKAETFLKERSMATDTPTARYETRTGFGYDVHAFAEPEDGRTLYLGGIAIPHDRGLQGHSDADVLLHAVCDALLGGASLGDIGILFPNTDPAYHNISSLRLLEVVRDRVAEAGWTVVHIDAAVVAEAPKLMPYRAAMQATIAESLGITPDRVSIKATTSEKMGFVGRREGMACWAVTTLAQK
jgi:2-C-methyl-D-erythritol 4-phosphate cytidylyltransferase/2-C-methyl-D-erythritol 2,4-cyclodiphosphate synthase